MLFQVLVSCAMRASIKTPRAYTRVRLALRAHTPKPLALAFVSLVGQGSPPCLLQPASKVAIAHQGRRAHRKVCDIQFAFIHLLLISALHLPCCSRLSSNLIAKWHCRTLCAMSEGEVWTRRYADLPRLRGRHILRRWYVCSLARGTHSCSRSHHPDRRVVLVSMYI